ncbi:ABC transporter permease [Actinokineospora cianjurensis]|uniref:NitT/TauT family transport system permease protein n=1 Tax=Actinokineospora cianjurensis TaxID=585224 RepID=A0A421AZI7_9PSEU|nr:ABC transporter permease [Actinokineospora cianjurensis]RLK55230.1 NitT/TauT family transport system permease protein [Actinokineospora cianjurensis]
MPRLDQDTKDEGTARVSTEATAEEVDGAIGGLDALDAPRTGPQRSRARRIGGAVLPPIGAAILFVAVWQAVWATAWLPEHQLPSPGTIAGVFWGLVESGQVWEFLWTSVHRAVIGFVIALGIATPLGLLLARVKLVRAAIGPLVSGLQSLPSVAWVPAAVIWFGLTDTTIYMVVLLGAVPSIANGLVAGIDQIPPILPRVGKVMGAGTFANARHILLPAALPGYLAGMKQGWAFSWRSLMAAELIASSPELGDGLGQFLHNGMSLFDMPMVITGIILILFVGVGIELLVFAPVEKITLNARGLRKN